MTTTNTQLKYKAIENKAQMEKIYRKANKRHNQEKQR
jgi:hypothetical protein